MEKNRAIEILEELKAKIPLLTQTPSVSHPEYMRWRPKVFTAIEYIFPNNNKYLESFNNISFVSGTYTTATKPGASERAFIRGLDKADALLHAMIHEIQTYWTDGAALARQSGQQASSAPHSEDTRKVFVVHGRNEALRKSMFDFLRAIGLTPLEWPQAVEATGHGTPYTGQILDNAFAIVQAVVVLMSPDDEVRLSKEFQLESDPDFEKTLTGQARPNVLFEAGMAMGRDASRTILVEIGHLRPFSDVVGRHVLRMNNSPKRRQELADRLRTAGCAVDLSGTDWHETGSFVLNADKLTSSPDLQKKFGDTDRCNLSEQAINILRQLVESGAEYFFYADWGGGQWTLQLSGGTKNGEQIGVTDPRFIGEDVNQLFKAKLITVEQNDDGHLICQPTRNGLQFVEESKTKPDLG